MRSVWRAGVFVLPAAVAAAIVIGGAGGVLRAGQSVASAIGVLGQITFTKTSPNLVDATGVDGPDGVAIDRTNGHVIVADTNNSRVLGWKSAAAFAAGGAADLVIGQPDFYSKPCNQNAPIADAAWLCTPIGVAFDRAHRVYVGDTGNNRVLMFDDPFAALALTGRNAGFVASKVFGQGGSFVSNDANAGGVSADSMASPQGVAVDEGGNLFVSDVFNNRVLIFFAPMPVSMPSGAPGQANDTTADVVIGQADFVGNLCNQGGSASSLTLCLGPFLRSWRRSRS